MDGKMVMASTESWMYCAWSIAPTPPGLQAPPRMSSRVFDQLQTVLMAPICPQIGVFKK